MTKESNKDSTNIPDNGVDKKARHSIPIESEVIGKESAAVLRSRFDKDKNGDNEINAVELGQMAREVNQKEKIIHNYQYVAFGLVAVTALLLCTTFASTWLAVKLQKDLDADNEQHVLISKKSGAALATLVHNQFCKLNVDHETLGNLSNRRKLMSTDDFQRHLQETPVFTVPATCVESSWQLHEQGNLGVMQFSSNAFKSATGVQIGLVGTDTVVRDVDATTGDVTYGPLYRKGDINTLFQVRCSGDALSDGECQGFLLSLSSFERGERRLCIGNCGCFSAQSTVKLESGSIKTMQELDIGDNVLVGSNKYQEIYGFGHRLSDEDATLKTEYRRITVARKGHVSNSSSVLELTPSHLIYRHGDDTPIPASLLKGTDLLVGQNGEVLQILKIEKEYRYGLYNPLTADGRIVVGGILVSTYTSFNNLASASFDRDRDSPNLVLAGFDTGFSWHSIEHAFFKPFAFYCTVLSNDGCGEETYTGEGYNYAASVAVMISRCLAQQNETNPVVQVLKVAASILALAVVAVAYAVTCFLESYVALLGLFIFGFGYVMVCRLESPTILMHGDWDELLGFALKVKRA
mmetsp:Transcript_29485/g.68786  ORF Transcript_29485/g.68786 Transcript_29485/m.68786 type:complete len:579 (-) Transcript_29485:3-1739(-)